MYSNCKVCWWWCMLGSIAGWRGWCSQKKHTSTINASVQNSSNSQCKAKTKSKTTCLHPLQLEHSHQPSFVRAFSNIAWTASFYFFFPTPRPFLVSFAHIFASFRVSSTFLWYTFLFTFTPRYYFLVQLCCHYQENIRRHTHNHPIWRTESSYRLTMHIAHRQQLKLFEIF